LKRRSIIFIVIIYLLLPRRRPLNISGLRPGLP
jgi:hypothetical protein